MGRKFASDSLFPSYRAAMKRTTEQRQRSLPANRQRKPTAALERTSRCLIGPDGRPLAIMSGASMRGKPL